MSSFHRTPIFWVGLDVHKESGTAAVFGDRDPEPLRVDRLPYDLQKIRRWFERLQRDGEARACYESSGDGYVLQRSLTEWGVPCELAAPASTGRASQDRSTGCHQDRAGLPRRSASAHPHPDRGG